MSPRFLADENIDQDLILPRGRACHAARLVDEIEVLGSSAGDTGLAAGVRELIEHLRFQADAIMSLADRLEGLALQR